ncbi:FtsK/SpoIIIE domain-containing protein [Nocardioides terrisoli]|uniref:FtsK/SpoIIIE domain-containing protein n=1 Tax=Nocardioides terrisoli TaxID=3388267 RepID=UPI00287BBA1A|nr:FtsK/SpoIIIE domain-containing protein [Nocardioides marmorisolisilvae]
MRISLTVETAEQSADVLVDCDDQTTAADLADALSGAVGASGAELVVGEDPATPSARVAELGLLDGHRVGLGHKVEPPPGVETRGWQLHVVSGPDAGAVFALPVGDHDVGRSGVVSFLDHAMSRRHCRITVSTNGATITDLGSSNGTRLDGALLEAQRPHPVELGQMIGIGHSVVTLRPARATDAVIEAAEPGHAHFLRQPRMLPPRTTLEVKVPAAPGDKPRRRIPMVAMLIPLAMGVLMAWLMSSPTYLLFALMSPAMMIGNLVSDMRGGAKDHRARVEKYHRDLEASQQQLAAAVHTEQNRLRSELPDAADTFLTCVLPGRRLWERRPYDVDALTLRVGTADLPSTVQLVGGTFDTQVDQSEHRLHCVPVAVDLKRAGVIGVAAPHDTVVSTLRWLTVQLCAFHPTRDLAVTVLTSRAEDHWRWVRWLPHLRPGTVEGSTAYVGNDPDSVSAQVSALIGLLTARKQAMQGGHGVKADSFPAHVLVVHGYRQVRTTLGLAQLLDEGPSVGIYAICADEDERLLPERCTSTIVADPTRPDFGTLRRTGESDVVDVLLEGVAAPWCERVARSLAPLVDVGADQGETMLPDSARLLEVVGFDPPQAGAIRARWALEPRSTAMTIGVGLDGPFTLDLRRDGPHGLIAGTTGSGKTELLQTMIASLALVNRPDELNFVLVDYKGDSAFKDCVNLPHTVGKVNDLDPHLVERALESLSAELRYREHFFAEAQVKDIEDYQLLQSKEPHRPSLPRLLLVIDEFAALFKELPDFVSGLVGIAQRGRSLGIHLLLATQRPSGVVSPEIRANTNLRVSLRVTDAADSVDILESPDAASIAKSSPGRGFARLGAGNLLSFQSGRVGGRRPGAVLDEVPPPFVAAVPWKALGYQQPQPPAAVARDDVKDTDLASLVEAVRAAAVEDGVPAQRQPWLPALPEKLTMAEVYDDLPAATLAVPPLPFGRSDLPQLQEQQPATFDLVRDGHLLVIGSARSGRSQLLRTLAGAIARLTSPRDVHLYGIDCGNGALNPFTSLPHCGAVVGRTEPERAGRLLGRIGAEMDRRQMLLAQHGFADIEEQRRSPESSLPHLVVMIDRWEGFTTSLADIDNGAMADMVTRILREGASLGVHLVISGDRTLAGNQIASMTEHKFAMRLADKGDFSLIGLSPRSLPDRMPPGRGFTPAGIEGQVLLLDEDESGQAQAAALVRLGEAAHARGELAEVADPAQRPFRLDVLPSRITLEEALALRPADAAPTLLPLAVGGDELTAMGPDLATSPSFLVAGPHRSGRSTTLLAAVHAAVSFGVQVVVAAPRPSPLRDLAGTAGVLQVFTDDEPEATYRELVASVPGPVLLVLDDAEELKDARAEDYFAEIVRGNAEGQVALLFGGAADALQLGFSGWHVEARKARRGLLLSPQESGDGDLVGLRLPRSAVGQPVQPGRGLLHLGDGQLVRVATVLP